MLNGRRGAGSAGRLAFVEVAPMRSESPLAVAQQSPRYEVVLAGGRVLRFTGGFDAARVRELVEVLESCDASREREQAEVLESC